MNNNFKNNIINNIKPKDETSVSNINTKYEAENKEQVVKKFKIGKKKENKIEKKPFPLYVDAQKLKELDKIVKKTNYSRNELINLMIDFCLENIEFVEQ